MLCVMFFPFYLMLLAAQRNYIQVQLVHSAICSTMLGALQVTQRPGQDNLAMNAIRFLTTVAKSVHHKLFADANVLKQICESIILPNLRVSLACLLGPERGVCALFMLQRACREVSACAAGACSPPGKLRCGVLAEAFFVSAVMLCLCSPAGACRR